MLPESLAFNRLPDIQVLFEKALSRLNYEDYKVKIGDDKFPFHSIAHPHVLLPAFAYEAETISMIMFGARLFTDTVYVVDKEKASGISMVPFDELPDDKKNNDYALMSIDTKDITADIATKGLVDLIIDLSVDQIISVDHEQKLITMRQIDLPSRELLADLSDYADGDIIPLLSAPLLAFSGLQRVLKSEVSMEALNAARRVAEDLDTRHRQQQESKGISL